MNHSKEVPLMFQAQVEGRCNLQFNPKNDRHPAYEWKNQWTESYPKPKEEGGSQKHEGTKQKQEGAKRQKPDPPVLRSKNKAKDKNKAWERFNKAPEGPKAQQVAKVAKVAKQKPKSGKTDPSSLLLPPKFGSFVKVRKYRVSWRLACDCGQDSFIRPAIGTRGYPYYPGSSMKGAFKAACKTTAQAQKYCGGEVVVGGEKKTQPGLLRFHGGYPVDTSWTKRLVDVVHSQQDKQVVEDGTTNAIAQISLYRVVLQFGISSPQLAPDAPEWQEIWQIWETALARGLGSRTSAGYGQFEVPKQGELFSVSLSGKGVASTLLGKEPGEKSKKTPELRPNMFKATLRGHTLRLLGGMTDGDKAKYLTKLLWGGFIDKGQRAALALDPGGDAIAGLLGISFEGDLEGAIDWHKYEPKNNYNRPRYTPIYDLDYGQLRILSMHGNSTPDRDREISEIAEVLIQFAMLLGGFGKSWRRIDHSLFFHKSYLEKKPSIGCHWKFAPGSESFYLPVDTLEDISDFIDEVREIIRQWASQQISLGGNRVASHWREAWHPYQDGSGVQVWAQFTDSSSAIKWFHGEETKLIYKSHLTGEMGTTGRIWHRMYPHYQKNDEEILEPTGDYIELLTIFPTKPSRDRSDRCTKFLDFLRQKTNFEKIWG